MKKLLAVLLAVTMLFTAAIIPAHADGVDVEVDVSDQFIPELINGFYFDCGDTDNHYAVLTGVGEDNKTLAILAIPKTITYGGEEFTVRAIAKDAFAECVNLTTINYAGNKAEWRAINIVAEGNTTLTKATINYTLLDNENIILPVAESITETSITLVAVDGCEYAIEAEPLVWQDSPVFEGLTPGCPYIFLQRYKETDTHKASGMAQEYIATLKPTPAAPAKPTLSSNTATTVTLKAVSGYEYSKDGKTWQTSNKFTGLSAGTKYNFYQRVAEDDFSNASPASEPLIVTTDKADQTAPAKPTIKDKTTTTVILNTVSGCEYSKDGVKWQSSTKFTGLKAYTTYKFYQRKKATSTKNASPKSVVLSVKTDCAHSYKTTVTTKATFTKNGKTTTKCTVCGNVSKTATVRYAKTVKLSTTTYTYDGKVKKPSVTVKDSAGKTISTTHYTVTYASGRKNAGKYKVTVKMKGYYTGTKTLYFTINPPKTTVSKLTAGKKSIKVAITKKSTQVTGYQIQYSTSKKFTSPKTKNITSYKTTSTTLTKLTSKKTYYVRVRTYKTASGKKYYSGWSTYKYTKAK